MKRLDQETAKKLSKAYEKGSQQGQRLEFHKLADLANIPDKIKDALFPFQRDGVAFLVGLNGRGMIGDEMGLGKTIQAIAVSTYYKDDWPVLVVLLC